MSIQRRNLLFLGLVSCCLLLIVWLVARGVVLREFATLEAREHRLHLRQLEQMLDAERTNLVAQSQDWAAWDDTYRFVVHPTPEYLTSGFANGGVALEGLDLDLLTIVDRSGKTVYGEVFFERGKLTVLPAEGQFHPFFGDQRFLEAIGGSSGISGFIMAEGRPLLIAAYPVLTSQNEGPSRGAVIMGRFLDEAQLQVFSQRFQYPLSWFEASQGPAEGINGDKLIGRFDLPAFDPKSAGTLVFAEHREIVAQGEHALWMLMGYLSLATVAVIALLYFLQEHFIFSRIRKLGREVLQAPKSGTGFYRVSEGSQQDEIGQLTGCINGMFEALESRRLQELALQRHQRLVDMGNTMAMIAHQWRQPLHHVGLVLQDFQSAYEFGKLDEAYLNHQVGVGMEEILRMSATIDEFSRIYRPQTTRSRFGLLARVKKACSLVFSNDDNIGFTIEGEEVEIEGYVGELTQAAIALLQNSREAIEVHKPQQAFVHAKLMRDEKTVSIVVEDNGGGIDEEHLPHIFEPYYSTKGVLQGVGNGLFMVKMAVESGMGGTVSVENIPGGVRATLVLPLG